MLPPTFSNQPATLDSLIVDESAVATSSQLHIEPSTLEAASVFTKAKLDNTRRRRPWTDEEDEILRKAVEQEHPDGSAPFRWLAIAKYVPGRTNKDCRKRWCTKMLAPAAKGGWSPEEDTLLVKAIEKYGTKWPLVSAMVGTRKSCQCARRWYDTLNPSIDRTPWSKDDDAKLLAAVNNHGKKWSYIAKSFFPGRTGLATKNRFVALATSSARHTSERAQSQSSDEDYTDLFTPTDLASPVSSESPLPPNTLFTDPYLPYHSQPDADYLSSRSSSLSTQTLDSQLTEEAVFLFQDQFPIFPEKQQMETYQPFPVTQLSTNIPFSPVPHQFLPQVASFDPLEGLFTDNQFDPWDPALLSMFQQLDNTQSMC